MKNNEIFNDEVKENLPTKEEILQNEDEQDLKITAIFRKK